MVQDLKAQLDSGKKLPFPDGILINGRGPNGASFNVEQGMRPIKYGILLFFLRCNGGL